MNHSQKFDKLIVDFIGRYKVCREIFDESLAVRQIHQTFALYNTMNYCTVDSNKSICAVLSIAT